MENGVSKLAHSFLIETSSELLVTRTGTKARTSSISGLWFPWPIYMFFEMRFDLGTLDSGERSLPFGLLVDSVPQLPKIKSLLPGYPSSPKPLFGRGVGRGAHPRNHFITRNKRIIHVTHIINFLN